MIRERYKIIAGIIGIMGVIIGVYSPVINGPFLWDDHGLVVNNMHIRSPQQIPAHFIGDIGQGSGHDYNFYRPLQMTSYSIDYALWQLRPTGYHLTNIFLHGVVTCMFFLIMLLLTRGPAAAFVVALWYGVHPVHTEAVSYIAGRADMLMAVFLLIGFGAYIKASDTSKPIYFYGGLLSFLAGLLSKESALIFPFICLGYSFIMSRKVPRGLMRGLMLCAVSYILLRLTVFAAFFPPVEKIAAIMPFLQRLSTFCGGIVEYLSLLIAPIGLHMRYGEEVFYPWRSLQVITGAMIIIGSFYAIMMTKKTRPLFSFGILWFMMTLLPVSNLFPVNAMLAEHWLYLPTMGIAIMFNGILVYSRRHISRPVLLACVGVVALYAVITVRHNAVYWQDPIRFYRQTMQRASSSVVCDIHYIHLGNAYYARKNYEKALEAFQQAIDEVPGNVLPYMNIAGVYGAQGDDERQLQYLEQARRIDPTNADVYNNLGAFYARKGDPETALIMFAKAIACNPDYYDAYLSRGSLYLKQKAYDEAMASFQTVIDRAPYNGKGYEAYAIGLCKQGYYQQANDYYTQAKKRGVRNVLLEQIFRNRP